jgi:hypothetical protein
VTTFFSDDFESGNLAAWTSVAGNPAVQSTLKRTGQYACSSTITSTYKSNYIAKTGTAQTSSYLRFYMYFSVLPPANSEVIIARCAYTSSRPLVTVYNDGSTTYWRLRDGAGTIRQYDSGPSAQTGYCIELKAVVADESALYLNGNKILSGTAPSGSSASVYLMAYAYYGIADGTIIAFDDFAYSDTYNGPQNLSQAVTDALSSDDLHLRNKQFPAVDSVSAAEDTFNNKSFSVTDHVANQSRALTDKQPSINDCLELSEAANIGIKGHVKTKLFLFLDDMAVQLTGD